MSDLAIRVDNLSKQYKIGARKDRRDTLKDQLTYSLKSMFRRKSCGSSVLGEPFTHDSRPTNIPETFWALKEVSFEVKQGETLGIIGRNGAGKSTLLKLLSRITEPTFGRAEMYGRVGSLLEVGVGFDRELTGRENTYLNGAILGMKKAEITRKFDEIVAFAEVDRFIDTPVKHYSSGMYVRLAFAVAAHLEPEILIVDEVLAVGDGAFQAKCLGKMGDVAKAGRTVLFVSHNMQAVTNLCGRAILLDQGSILENGDPPSVIGRYLKGMSGSTESGEREWNDLQNAPGNDKIRLHRVCIRPEEGSPADEISIETPICFEVEYWNLVADSRLIVDMILCTIDGSEVLECDSTNEPTWHGKPLPEGLFRSVCRIPGHFLNEGTFHIRLIFVDEKIRSLCSIERIVVFSVQDLLERDIPWYGRYKGPIRPQFAWSTVLLKPTSLSISR